MNWRPSESVEAHESNRITLDLAGKPHDLLLVRLMHPAGRSTMGSARWLVGRSAFRELAGLESA